MKALNSEALYIRLWRKLPASEQLKIWIEKKQNTKSYKIDMLSLKNIPPSGHQWVSCIFEKNYFFNNQQLLLLCVDRIEQRFSHLQQRCLE